MIIDHKKRKKETTTINKPDIQNFGPKFRIINLNNVFDFVAQLSRSLQRTAY